MNKAAACMLICFVVSPALADGVKWYYCPPLRAYYPSVQTCPIPWQPVDPQVVQQSPPTIQPPKTVAPTTVTPNTDELKDIIGCAGVFRFFDITNELAMEKAPAYAREKYQRKREFYTRGGVNLYNRAKSLPGFTEERFETNGKAIAKVFYDGIRSSTDRELPGVLQMLNSRLADCMDEADLSVSDLP